MSTNNIISIKNKVIIVTGASRGIGRYIALELAKQSTIVYAVDLRITESIPKYLSKNFFQIKCNITHKSKFENLCDKIYNKHNKIDVLINNAGVTFPGKEGKLFSYQSWNKTLTVNLTAAFTCSQAVIKHMRKKKQGSIINITSINAELAFPNNPAYVASKGGLKMLGKALAKDWGKYGIRVNNLGPGYIKTEMNMKSYRNPKKRKKRENQTMLNRWGEMSDIVGVCIFLSSDASSYITGQDVYVDGGWTANGL